MVDSNVVVHGRLQFVADGTNAFSPALGDWEVEVYPNDGIEPEGTVYRITEQRGRSTAAIHHVSVPGVGGPYTVLECLADVPGALPMGALLVHINDTTAVHGIPDTALLVDDAQLTTAVAGETTRATIVEAGLSTGLANEIARATSAEVILTADLSDEVAARIADVTAEESRALAAESELGADIAGLGVDLGQIDTATAAHAADTTGVHGIFDTSQLVVTSDPRMADQRTPLDNSVTQAKVQAGSLGIDRLSVDPRARATHTGTQLASTISDLTTNIRSNRLDQMAAPTAPVSMNGQRITNGALPTTLTDVITKEYADALRAGLLLKPDPARVMVATNVNINAPGSVLDSVALSVDDRVLLTGQTSANDNGIYLFKGAATPMVRSSDANTSEEMRSGTAIWITAGTYEDQRWALITADPITLGTTAQTWAFDGGLAQVTAGDGLEKTGNRLDVIVGTGMEVAGDTIGIAAGGVGTTELGAGAVTNAKVEAGAAIDQSKIAGLPTALDDLESADTAESNARAAADSTLTTNLAAEVTNRTNDVNAEESARIAADALKVDKATLNANSVLAAVTDDTPLALSVPASTVVGRKAAGNVVALTGTEVADLVPLGYFIKPGDLYVSARGVGATPGETGANTRRTLIQNAIDALGVAGGGVFEFEVGVWGLDNPLYIPSNVTVRGTGWGSIIRMVAPTTIGGGVLVSAGYAGLGNSNITVRDIQLDQNYPVNTTHGCVLTLSKVNGFLVENVMVKNTSPNGYGIWMQDTGQLRARNGRVISCHVTKCHMGIETLGARQIDIIGNTVELIEGSSEYGIAITANSEDIGVIGNNIYGVGYGIGIVTGSKRIRLADNIVRVDGEFPAFVADGSVTDYSVSGGEYYSALGVAMSLQAGTDVQLTGVRADGLVAGINLVANGIKASVVGCRVHARASNPAGTAIAIQSDASSLGCSFIGNRVTATGANPEANIGMGLSGTGHIVASNQLDTCELRVIDNAVVTGNRILNSMLRLEGNNSYAADNVLAGTSTLLDTGTNNTLASGNFVGQKVTRNSVLNIAISTWTLISWAAFHLTPNYEWVPGAPTRLTVSKTGKYRVTADITYYDTTAAQGQLAIYKNGVSQTYSIVSFKAGEAQYDVVNINDIIELVATDYLELGIWYNGGALSLPANTSKFTVQYLGP
ncbi:MAG: hypothetical protein LC798_19620 [Chloroflexi bacterium]|nr:hypothetical protein [Chloroflexota bacterium]